MSSVLGFDVSSHAIDLVHLDETTNAATWTRLPLHGDTAFDRLRQTHAAMRQIDYNNVYLAAIERPKTRFMPSAAALFPIFGAVVNEIPHALELWDVRPTDWRKGLGLPGNAKKEVCAARAIELGAPAEWVTQDTYDAWAVAFFARELNARGILLEEAREKQLLLV